MFHGDLNGALELGVAAGDDVGRRLLDLHVGRHALVLDDEAFARPDAEVRRGDLAAVHQHRKSEDADQAAPRPRADQRSELQFAEHPRQEVAAGAGGLVDDHHLRPLNGRARRLHVGAVAHRPVGDHRLLEVVDVVVGEAAAAVVALVHDHRLFVRLRVEVPLEVGEPLTCGIGNVDVRDLAAGRGIDFPDVRFHPVAIPQRRLVRDWNDRHGA